MPAIPERLAISPGGWLPGGSLSTALRGQELIHREFVVLTSWLLNRLLFCVTWQLSGDPWDFSIMESKQ